MIYLRDYIMSAAIFGFFSFVWFGWAQADIVTVKSHVLLGICGGIAVLLSILGGYLSYRDYQTLPSALNESTSFRWYLIIFVAEFLLALIGALLLLKFHHDEAMITWISFIVGSHFIALQFVFRDPSLYLLAALMIIISLLAIIITPKFNIPQSSFVGISDGVLLLAFSGFNFIRFFAN